MQIFGNILIGLASFIYVLPLQLLLGEARRASRNDGGALWGGIFVFLPLWLLLTIALSVATARGGLDWLPVKRGGQHALVILAGIALLATSLFGFFGRVENAGQLPVVSRLFLGWADLVLPLVTIAFLVLTVNASLGASVPAVVYRAPFAVLAGLSLIHGVALLGEWFVRSQQAQIARVESEAKMYSDFEREMLERLKTLDPEKDLAELLDRADHSNPEIHAVVLAKLAAHPNLRDGIASVLRTWRADAAFSYLAAVDISAEERAALAPAVLDGIGQMTRLIDDEIARSTHFRADDFDPRTRRILTVADKFEDAGVDFTPALRALRAVFDAEEAAKVHLNARGMLDAWLARHRP
jgi:hypothetical protein